MFGIDLFDAALIPAMTVAALAGVLSFLSPCVLPIVPPYLAYMSGISVGEMKQGRSPLPLARSSLAMPICSRLLPGSSSWSSGRIFWG